MRFLYVPLALMWLAGCCGDPPQWLTVGSIHLEEGSGEFELLEWVAEPGDDLAFDAACDDEGLIAYTEGSLLLLQAQPGWEGVAVVALTATNDCDRSAETTVEVTVGEPVGDDDDDDTVDPFVDPCGVTFAYEPQTDPDKVAVAGAFNDWNTDAHLLEEQQDGSWTLFVPGEEWAPGAYPYKFVEMSGAYEAYNCDPRAPLIHCEEGYKEPSDTSWTQDCTAGNESCNSMLVVRDFDQPRLVISDLTIDGAGGSVELTTEFRSGCAGDEPQIVRLELDGVELVTSDGVAPLTTSLTDLSLGRHTLTVTAQDTAGREADPLHVPLWIEDTDGWDRGVMYYAFMDRFANGDASIDTSEGATYELGGYMGGDLQGLVDALDYLQDLGVNIIWISNPQDNAEGPWGGDCGTYSGYHG